ncbi:MAG: hypothetical protein K9H16_02490, partial [Bacteroidales bacterium]|nr:hypothetical protein [Bacteroidales bacterium]
MNKINLNKSILFLLVTTLLFAISCHKIDSNVTEDYENRDITELAIPDQFDFNTSDEVEIIITALNNQNQAIKNVRIDIYSDWNANEGQLMASGNTDANGMFQRIHPIPDYYEKIIVATRYLGFPSEVEVHIVDGKVRFTLGGTQKNQFKSSPIPFKATNSVFQPMGPWDASGTPLYLEPVNDVIDNEFLTDINASFPESHPVPQFHPEYIDPENEYDFKLLEPSDV